MVPRRTFLTLSASVAFQAFGGRARTDKAHFVDGGSFDQIFTKK